MPAGSVGHDNLDLGRNARSAPFSIHSCSVQMSEHSRSRSRLFGIPTFGSAGWKVCKLNHKLHRYSHPLRLVPFAFRHERLEGVVFESLDWAELIPRYDTPDTLFYLDPPYWGGENDYGKLMFERDDFQKMANVLKNIQGRFILLINDVPEIREMFDGFHMEPMKLKYSISAGANTEAAELIITDREVVTGLF